MGILICLNILTIMKFLVAVFAVVATTQAYPGSRATCEECVTGMTNLPAKLFAMRDDLENDMSHHYCHKPDDPCYIQDFVNDWFPAVLDNFVGGAAQDVCSNLGACAECTTGLHALSKWLESEEQVVQHVAFLPEGV